jgi:hypothetical protein
MPVLVLERLLRYRFYKAGYPTAVEDLARHYFMVIWDIGSEGGFTTYKMSLS